MFLEAAMAAPTPEVRQSQDPQRLAFEALGIFRVLHADEKDKHDRVPKEIIAHNVHLAVERALGRNDIETASAKGASLYISVLTKVNSLALAEAR